MKRDLLTFSKLTVLIVLIGIVTIGSGCEKEKSMVQSEKQLIGTWRELEPYSDNICDTIVFKADNTIGLYIPLEGGTYQLLTKDSILFTTTSGHSYRKNIIFLEKDIILINNFLDRSLTQKVKNIQFKRL